jgi:hypothetical protein
MVMSPFGPSGTPACTKKFKMGLKNETDRGARAALLSRSLIRINGMTDYFSFRVLLISVSTQLWRTRTVGM